MPMAKQSCHKHIININIYKNKFIVSILMLWCEWHVVFGAVYQEMVEILCRSHFAQTKLSAALTRDNFSYGTARNENHGKRIYRVKTCPFSKQAFSNIDWPLCGKTWNQSQWKSGYYAVDQNLVKFSVSGNEYLNRKSSLNNRVSDIIHKHIETFYIALLSSSKILYFQSKFYLLKQT